MNQQQRALSPEDANEESCAVEPPFRKEVTLTTVKAPAQVEATAEDGWLDLPIPDRLPAETSLGEPERHHMHGVLSGLLDALALDHPTNIERLDALLADLGKAEGDKPEIDTTGLPITTFQATDYDRYFRVNRQSVDEPAVAMVRSLVQTVRAVMHLFARSQQLPAVHIRRQVEGFESHAHLLARTFGLEPLR